VSPGSISEGVPTLAVSLPLPGASSTATGSSKAVIPATAKGAAKLEITRLDVMVSATTRCIMFIEIASYTKIFGSQKNNVACVVHPSLQVMFGYKWTHPP
jgi:hypothetical protein